MHGKKSHLTISRPVCNLATQPTSHLAAGQFRTIQKYVISFCRDEVERLAKECKMRLYRTSVKEDLNVSGVFQHLAENYVNKVKSFNDHSDINNPPPLFQIGASSRTYSTGIFLKNLKFKIGKFIVSKIVII